MEHHALVLIFTILLNSISTNSTVVDVLGRNETIRDGDTIVIANSKFELGFFSLGGSRKRYLGIWFKKISYGTAVSVANRDAPLNNTSGILRIDNKAISLYADAGNMIIWSSNYSKHVNKPVAQLLDTGNLVVRDKEMFVWQSFDYVGDTLLPGMRVGKDLVTGLEQYFSSWKSVDDPSPGSFVHRMDTHGYPQLMLWNGSKLYARSGPWVGNRFSGIYYKHNCGGFKFLLAQT